MQWKILDNGMVLLICCITCFSCRETPRTIASTYSFIDPVYRDIQLTLQGDSLHFPLSRNTYNEIKSFNYFEHNGGAFISFYDRRSQSVNIYHFSSQKRVKKVYLKKCFKDQSFYKTSVYVINFDSIFVTMNSTLYLMDSSGSIKNNIDFFKGPGSMAYFDNVLPVIAEKKHIYMGVRPYIDQTSQASIRRWRALYEFDLTKNEKKLFYPLPLLYQSNLYGDRFFDYNYCYNDRGNLVFSFPADTCIYETNLADHHKAYYAKSRFQRGTIFPVPKESLQNDAEEFKQFNLRDIYGPVFFDPYKKRYLRVAKQKISKENINQKNFKRKQSIIVFDNSFRIIGESETYPDFSSGSLFFTPDGGIYSRVNPKDEYALHFVRLTYKEQQADSASLTLKKTILP